MTSSTPPSPAAGTLVAVSHAEHRQVSDKLVAFLRTYPTDPAYEGEWQALVTTLDAHAEERDLIPPPVEITADELDGLGNRMLEQMDEVRTSLTKQLCVQARGAVLRKM